MVSFNTKSKHISLVKLIPGNAKTHHDDCLHILSTKAWKGTVPMNCLENPDKHTMGVYVQTEDPRLEHTLQDLCAHVL